MVYCDLFLINFLVLHPKHKSSYFIKAGWPSDWIRTAEGLLCSQYQNYYQPNQSDGLERPSVSVQLHYQHLIKTATLIILTNEQASSSQKDYFEELDSYSSTAIGDPIDEWLSTPALTNVNDGLSWWTAMDQTAHSLARMALDFLSAPGTYDTHPHNSEF